MKIHSWVEQVAQISTKLSVGTICLLHHQQQPQRQTTATETEVTFTSTKINRGHKWTAHLNTA